MFPRNLGAASSEPGGTLYVPTSRGFGRISNPTLYNELYLADTAAGAIAETFGSRDIWQDSLFDHRHGRFAVATFELDRPTICDLDDALVLVSLALRPSRVVTRQRQITQAWSAGIFNAGGYDGISWWSYYDADWTSFGIWNTSRLRHAETRELSTADPDVISAANTIARRII